MKIFDLKSLAEFNGSAGKPIYVAYQGKVFDVSGSKMWKGGRHMNRHTAANDLSLAFQSAPHGEEVLGRYPQVGILTQETEKPRSMPSFLSFLLKRIPMLERHPHPMTVHFPIVFLLSAAFFNFLYLITDNRPFETTAFYCLIGGILFLPVGMLTGLFTWWLNYLAKSMRPVTIKIICSCAVLFIAVIIFFWRILHPDIMYVSGMPRIIYFAANLTFVPLISVIGWLGAGLTFPVRKESSPIQQSEAERR
jgi:predicted heme/steroid binding protein/uncharacterized membrane protein